jgi:hypothetical protein
MQMQMQMQQQLLLQKKQQQQHQSMSMSRPPSQNSVPYSPHHQHHVVTPTAAQQQQQQQQQQHRPIPSSSFPDYEHEPMINYPDSRNGTPRAYQQASQLPTTHYSPAYSPTAAGAAAVHRQTVTPTGLNSVHLRNAVQTPANKYPASIPAVSPTSVHHSTFASPSQQAVNGLIYQVSMSDCYSVHSNVFLL